MCCSCDLFVFKALQGTRSHGPLLATDGFPQRAKIVAARHVDDVKTIIQRTYLVIQTNLISSKVVSFIFIACLFPSPPVLMVASPLESLSMKHELVTSNKESTNIAALACSMWEKTMIYKQIHGELYRRASFLKKKTSFKASTYNWNIRAIVDPRCFLHQIENNQTKN